MEENKRNKVLIALDVSNFEYVILNSAFSRWQKRYHGDASIIRPAEETDQTDLPNILNIKSFRKVLSETTEEKLEVISWIAKTNHQAEIDSSDGIDVVMTEDSNLSGNFRKILYPEYKAQRKLIARQYDVPAIKDYIQNVLFKELEVEERYGYRIVHIENCESDDIIAVLMKRFTEYPCRILISSDRDFLQLENVNQYDMWGNKIEIGIRNHEDFTMTKKEYLYWKILRGDVSDNIKNVFPKYGDVKSYKLIKDKPLLKKMLSESQEAAARFILNKTLIDFNEIPTETENLIYSVLKDTLNKKTEKERIMEFSMEECLKL